MKFVNLEAKTGKDEPNIIKITNRKLDETLKDGTLFEIPAERFAYPQIESREEFTALCGTQENELDVLNSFLRDASMTEGKNRIRMATTGTQEEIVAAGIKAAADFTFVPTVTLSGAEAKEKLSNLKTLVDAKELTDAEIAAKVRAMFGV